MRKLFEFIRSIYVVVLFVALEVAAISYYAHSTHYTQARLLARSNQVAGGVHGFFAGIRRYFILVIFALLVAPAYISYDKTNDEVYYDMGQCLPEDMEYVIANISTRCRS